jgi:hypothetical protein
MEPNANLSPQITHQPSLLGGAENMKLLFDNTMALTQAALLDNQRDARRRASNDADFDHLVSMSAAAALLNATQAGEDSTTTATQAGQGTVATAAGAEETANAGVAVSAQAVATSLGNLASALVPIITAAGGVVTAQTLAALLPVVVSAVGGASTPSQTEAKPTA